MRMKWFGIDDLAGALQRKSEADFEAVRNKSLLEMRDRAVKSSSPSRGGTPVDSRELQLSAGVNLSQGFMGYTKDYAPHVEFGHRLVRKNRLGIKKQIGYVPGQYFLKTNVSIQNPIYREDLERKMEE